MNHNSSNRVTERRAIKIISCSAVYYDVHYRVVLDFNSVGN